MLEHLQRVQKLRSQRTHDSIFNDTDLEALFTLHRSSADATTLTYDQVCTTGHVQRVVAVSVGCVEHSPVSVVAVLPVFPHGLCTSAHRLQCNDCLGLVDVFLSVPRCRLLRRCHC